MLGGWSAIVLMTHLRDLGVNPSVLGRLYNLGNYPGLAGAADLAALWAGHLVHVGAAAAVAAASLGLGLEALILLAPAWPGTGIRVLFALGTGFSLMALAMLGGGLTGFWHWAYPLALIVAGLYCLGRSRAVLMAVRLPAGGSPEGTLIKVVCSMAVLFSVFVALSPEVFYDSLVYHVADPFNWAKVHKVVFLPYNFFSNFPFAFS